MAQNADRGPFCDLRVVDFSNYRTGAQASQPFADFGADVIHVEPRGGSPLRDEPSWPFWGRGKRSIQLDLHDSADLAAAIALAKDADVVIETFRPGVADRMGLGYAALSAENPGLVYASISGFGSQGPLTSLKGYEGVVAAKLGVFSALADMPPPPEHPGFVSAAYCAYPASQLAAQGIFAALMVREDTGRGQHVETSLAQGLTVHDTYNWFARVLAKQYGEGFKQVPRVSNGVPTGGLSFRLLIALTKDGRWLQFSQTQDRLFRAMMKMFGLEWMFDDPEWEGVPNFDDHDKRKAFWEILLNIVRSKTADEWSAEFDRDPNVWAEVFRRDSELLDHPQMIWNKMVATIEDPVLGPVRQPGPIVRMEGTPATLDRSAPGLGEHDEAIRETIGTLRREWAATGKGGEAAPLAGMTVIELGTYYAAPYAATLLAEYGARVIKLEQPDGDPHRHMLPFPEIAGLKVLQGKESVGIDLHSEQGREIAHKIIAGADVVLQSFRAGVAKRLQLDAETLRGLNPDLVYLSAPGYGEDGPCGHRPAFAPTIGAAAGMAWRNAGASIPQGADLSLDQVEAGANQLASAVMGVGNSDGLSAVTAATALMAGLYVRKLGKGGQKMVTSMLSSTAHALAEVMVEYPGKPPVATADRGLHGFSATYRLYRASDAWLFFAAPKQSEWERFVAAISEAGPLASDSRFADGASRKANDAALVEALSALFATRSAADWEKTLLAADVACVVCAPAPVESNFMDEGSVGDVSGFVTSARHPIMDDVPRLAPLVRFSTSATVAGNAGLVGQQSVQVLSDYGYSQAEIDALAEQGTILIG